MFGGKRVRYGDARHQFGVLRISRRSAEPQPIVVFVHGGSWATPYNRWVMWLLVRDARRRGWATCNVEYRKLGRLGGGGGWPMTFDDVRHAVEMITEGEHERSGRVDRNRVAVVGHSAGGHLAMCAAGQSERRAPALVVSLAGPTDLEQISANGSPTVDALVTDAPEPTRWQLTSPVEMVPFNAPVLCLHGDTDTTVGAWNAERLADLDAAEMILVPGETHVDPLKPASAMWQAAAEAITTAFS